LGKHKKNKECEFNRRQPTYQHKQSSPHTIFRRMSNNPLHGQVMDSHGRISLVKVNSGNEQVGKQTFF
jgi:hypothetical protein